MVVKKAKRTKRCNKYKFDKMKVGDSFIFKEEDRYLIASACSQYGTRHGMRFSTGKDTRGFWRCWRDR